MGKSKVLTEEIDHVLMIKLKRPEKRNAFDLETYRDLSLATDIRVAAIARLLPDIIPIMESEDFKEGIQSFIERRDAKFNDC